MGATNVADGTNRIKGTSDLLPAGSAATVDTISAPQISRDWDYTVTIRVVDTGLVTTPEHPSNSDQTAFTLRLKNTVPVTEPPQCVAIPVQVSVSGDSVSMNLRQYFRNDPTSYSVTSTIHTSGFNPGSITLVASNLGVVTTQGGIVAPHVDENTQATYTVTLQATNAGGSVSCVFTWRIVPGTQPPEGAPAFIVTRWQQLTNYEFRDYDPSTGRATGRRNYIDSTNRGDLYIEGIGSSLYALFEHTAFGTLTITPGGKAGTTYPRTPPQYVSVTVSGNLIRTNLESVVGLTSIGTTLYTFGRFSNGVWKLFSIDPSTRNATEVNSSITANNLGLSATPTFGGLTSIGSTIYATVQVGSIYQFISIPISGGQAGIATIVNSNLNTGLPGTITGIYGLETFGSQVQALISRSGLGTFENVASAFAVNTATGGLTRVATESPYSAGGFFLTQYAISRPVASMIPTQLVHEGFPISFPMGTYVTGAISYRFEADGVNPVGQVIPIPPAGPVFRLEIDNAGLIRGISGSRNAPLVFQDRYYTIRFYAGNSAGEISRLVTIGVLNGAPLWAAIPEQFVDEGQVINFSVAQYVSNQPTAFSIGTIVKPRPEAPNIDLQISATGQVRGVGITINAPEVDQNERYTVPVTAENTAGARTTNFSLTIVDLGEADARNPFVYRWELPLGAQDGSFEIPVDLNVRATALCPGSFFYEGIELSGTPFLQWAPVPSNDIAANRPTAAQRNLDYITSPVPESGTKYYKLIFPRDILPDILKDGDSISVYLSAHSLRRGRTS